MGTPDSGRVWELPTGRSFLHQIEAAIDAMDPASVLVILEQAYTERANVVAVSAMETRLARDYAARTGDDSPLVFGDEGAVWEAETQRYTEYVGVLHAAVLSAREIERRYWHDRSGQPA